MIPADALLHPVFVLSLTLLVVNDHVLKATWPGPLTGKLSDVMGLIVAPLTLQAIVEVTCSTAGWSLRPRHRTIIACVILVGVTFALIKTVPGATEVYREGLGLLQWPFASALAVVGSAPIPSPDQVTFNADPTDLAALPALAVPTWIGVRHSRIAWWNDDRRRHNRGTNDTNEHRREEEHHEHTRLVRDNEQASRSLR
jgi:hypothetical protein